MVKNKKVFILLPAFMVFLNSLAYSKSRKIEYLPSDTTMESVSKDYTNPADQNDDSNFILLRQLNAGECKDEFKGIAACRKCAKLRKECPDCCLTDITATPAIQCTPEASDDYDCAKPAFQIDECLQVECGSRPGDSGECDDKLECGGGVSSGSPYGLQRRGCPEKDSGDLAPAGNCKEVDGTGLDRVWECESPDYQPEQESPGCVPESSLGWSMPSKYYSVAKADTSCISWCTPNPCVVNCAANISGGCINPSGTCPPSCAPDCSSSILSSDSSARAACRPSGCEVSSFCSGKCETVKGSQGDSCAPDTCSSSCGEPKCDSMSARWTDSPKTFYIYTLTQKFKDYITNCAQYADDYEACEDGITCCQRNVCSGETLPGFKENCAIGDKCGERSGCINAKFCDESLSEGECIKKVREAAECLIGKENDNDAANNLFQEVSSDVRYEFTARGGESLTIDWQVVLKSLDREEIEEMEGVSFYTLVKVEEIKASGVPAAHVSMLNIRDMDNAFSIYGLTHVSGKELTPGRKYAVKIYYFFPQAVECRKNLSQEYENVPAKNYEVKVKQLFLNIVRVKE